MWQQYRCLSLYVNGLFWRAKVVIILFMETPYFVSRFTTSTIFICNFPILFENTNDGLDKGIIIFVIFYFCCHLKIQVLDPPQKQWLGINFLNVFFREFCSAPKMMFKIHWCNVQRWTVMKSGSFPTWTSRNLMFFSSQYPHDNTHTKHSMMYFHISYPHIVWPIDA